MGRGHRNDEKCKAQQRCRIWKILWAEYRKSTLRCLPRSVSHNYHQSCASKQISKQTNQQQCQRPVNSDEHVWRPGEGLEVVILRGICVGFCCWCCCFDVQTVEHGSCLWHCQNVWTTICPMPPSIHRHLTLCSVCFCLCLRSNWSRILLWTTSKKICFNRLCFQTSQALHRLSLSSTPPPFRPLYFRISCFQPGRRWARRHRANISRSTGLIQIDYRRQTGGKVINLHFSKQVSSESKKALIFTLSAAHNSPYRTEKSWRWKEERPKKSWQASKRKPGTEKIQYKG